MQVLVLGGNGFIGSHMIDQLLARGHSPRVLDRSENVWRGRQPGVSYYIGDFSDSTLIAEALQGVDIVMHLLSSTVPSTSNMDPIADIRVNLEMTVRVLQLMVAADVHRIFYFSSGGTVYGNPQQLPIPEDHPLNPICSYGVVKMAAEKYIHMFQALYGLKPLIVRPSNPYGSRQGHSGVQGAVATFLKKTLSGEVIKIWGDGKIRRDYIHIADLVDFCMMAMEREETGLFNVASGVGISLTELLDSIRDVTGLTPKIEYLPARSFDVDANFLDITKATERLGWRPRMSLEDGIAEYCAWLREAGVL